MLTPPYLFCPRALHNAGRNNLLVPCHALRIRPILEVPRDVLPVVAVLTGDFGEEGVLPIVPLFFLNAPSRQLCRCPQPGSAHARTRPATLQHAPPALSISPSRACRSSFYRASRRRSRQTCKEARQKWGHRRQHGHTRPHTPQDTGSTSSITTAQQ